MPAARSPLTPIDEALDTLLQSLSPLKERVTLPLNEALGRVLASAQQATLAVPDHDNSAMDGFVLRHADLASGQRRFPVSQTIAAGHVGQALAPGTAARIFTGAVIPPGGDVVIIQENTRQEGAEVEVLSVPEPGANIRLRGHDIMPGTEILPAGARLRPQDLGMLSSLGIASAEVQRPLRVALLNTGDEVVAPGQPLQPGQIYDSNSYLLEGLLQRLGMQVQRQGIIVDSLEATMSALEQAAASADAVISTGGVSVGDADYVRTAVERLGELQLWKLAIKPGKPFSYGRVGQVPFFGLPGNPVAVFVTFVMLVRPCLLKRQGAAQWLPRSYRVQAGFSSPAPDTRQEYIRVRCEHGTQGPRLQPYGNQGSSILTSLSWADGLAVLPVGQAVQEGDWLDYYPFEGVF